jgi:hypothetical protein
MVVKTMKINLTTLPYNKTGSFVCSWRELWGYLIGIPRSNHKYHSILGEEIFNYYIITHIVVG